MMREIVSYLVEHIALKVLNMSIAASVIIFLILVARIALKKAPKIFSYMLWGIVLFRLLCPVTLSTPVSVFNLMENSEGENGEIAFITSEQITIAGDNDDLNKTTEMEPHIPEYIVSGEDGTQTIHPQEKLDEIMPNQSYSENMNSGVSKETMTEANGQESVIGKAKDNRELARTWAIILSFLWITGGMIIFSVNVVRFICLRRKVAVSMCLRENIYLCDEIQTPFCLGVIRPKIYMPSKLGSEEMEYIILHEKHHIKRCDHIVKMLAFMALCIHWFNPMVWIAFILAGKDMEMSCDEAVMKKMGWEIRARYSASLLQLATGKNIISYSPLSFGEGDPKQRIKNIMNYKEPAFWVRILSVFACVLLGVIFLSNPQGGHEAGPDESTETSAEMEEIRKESTEADSEGGQSSENTEDSVESSDRLLLNQEYERVINLAAGAVSDPLAAQGEMERFQGEDGNLLLSDEFFIKNDDSSQELGYLVTDINGDGTDELLLGINYRHENAGEEHIVLDLFTIKDGSMVHVLSGWWRNRYYLTENGNFINERSSSADESGIVYYKFDGSQIVEVESLSEKKKSPEFIPFDADMVTLSDIDGNGQMEYVVFTSKEDMHDQFVYYFNGENIYKHEDLLDVDIIGTEYIDLDHDGENEVVIVMEPHVNSMPLMEYAVIKKEGSSWKKLKMYQGSNILDNSFPIHVVKEKGDFEAEIYCEGQDTPPIIFNVENQYTYWNEYAKASSDSFGHEVVKFYEAYPKNGVGSEVAFTCAYGIWNIQSGVYEGLPCLIAEQGIQGYSKEDFWGNVFVYFDYDARGKIHILDTKFVQFDQGIYVSDDVRKQVEVFADHWDEIHTSFAEESYLPQFALVDLNHDNILELIVSEVWGTGHYSYTGIYQVKNGALVEIKNNMFEKSGGSEPDILVSWFDMYRDSDDGMEYYMTQDDLRLYANEFYQTFYGMFLANDGQSLECEMIAKEHILYNPESHEYFDNLNHEISLKEYTNLVNDYYLKKGYEHRQVHFGWKEKKKTAEYATGRDGICGDLLASYEAFREVDGDVDFQKISVSNRLDENARKVYFSCGGKEAAVGFEIMPYWDYLLKTQSMDEEEPLISQYRKLLVEGGAKRPGMVNPDVKWDIDTSGSSFVARKSIYGYTDFLDYWGTIEVTFNLSLNGNILVRKVEFVPDDFMMQLSGKYKGIDYKDSYDHIISAYRDFSNYMKNGEGENAYRLVGMKYINEEFASAIGQGTPVFSIEDLNQDGTPELFIGIQNKQGDISIYDVYTWHDGETSQLMREIGYRNGTCILCEDGIIENVVSGSYNEYSVKYQRLPKEGTELETVEIINCTPVEGKDTCRYEYQGKEISEDEANLIMEKHPEHIIEFSEMK